MRTIVFTCVIAVTSAAVWRSTLPKLPERFGNQTGCYIKEIDNVVPFGETVYPIGNCYKIECSSSELNYASCGVAFTNDKNCYITETDLTKPYSECCPQIKCNHIEQEDQEKEQQGNKI